MGTFSVIVVVVNAAMMVGYCVYLGATGYVPETAGVPLPPSPAVHLDIGDLFRAAGVVCFAYTPILNLFPVRKEMVEPSKAPLALRSATLLCFAAYLITGLAGNLVFRSATQSNCIYNTLPPHRMPFRLFWFALVVCITLLYPIINFPMVVSLESIFGRTAYSRQIISTLGCVLVVMVTIVVTDIADLFGLCSSLGLGSVMFVIPCWCYLKVDPAPLRSRRKIGAVLSLILGLSIVFVSTGFIFVHIACVNTKGVDHC